MLRFPAVFLFALCSWLAASAQVQVNYEDTATKDTVAHAVGVGVRMHGGYLLPHRPIVKGLVKGHISVLELEVNFGNNCTAWWQMDGRCPEVGASLFLWRLGNPEVLGNIVSIAPFLAIPVARTKRLRLDWRGSVGLGYFTKPFDRVSNFTNIAIGSRVNAYMAVSAMANYQLSRKLRLTSSVGFHHFSNGAWKMPNLGINLPTAAFGLTATLGTRTRFRHAAILLLGQAQHEWNVWGAAGLKEINPPGSPKYSAVTLGVQRVYGLSNVWGLVAAANVYHDYSIPARVLDDFEARGTLADRASLALLGGIAFRLDKLSIHGHIGWLALAKHRLEGSLVNRLALRYRVQQHWSANISLKSHKAKADYLEAGIVYHILRW